MEVKGKKVLVCNCEVSMALDGKKVARALGASEGEVHTQLCRAQIESFRRSLAEGRPVIVGCTQEAPLFEETRAESSPDAEVGYTNIRERAGWSEEGERALPKIAALLAEAALDIPPTPTVLLKSGGEGLIYGHDSQAIEAARQLSSRLSVTVLLSEPSEIIPPRIADVPIFRGTIRRAGGHIGAFDLEIEGHAAAIVSSRAELAFDRPQGRVTSRCDLILDLSGKAPLFPAPEKRDGYFRPDPGSPAAVQRALFDLTDLVGEFEKPRYVRFDAELCVHSRSRRTGCTRCLEVCPASAIAPDGDVVAIDPFICGGCGGCNSVCPTGAASYDYPPAGAILERLRTLLSAYRQAGGEHPVLLVHDEEHGLELISLMSRFGRGLPANVIPFAVNEVTQLGLDALLSALAYGAGRILFLVPPKRRGELAGLEAQIGYAETALTALGYGGGRLELMSEVDPDAVERRLFDLPPSMRPMPEASFLPMGGKRAIMRMALAELHKVAPSPVETVPLPEGAPFGLVRVDVAGCTLCLACVSACPTGALQDNPERPELRFQEDACVQCGLCMNTCPEKVIALEPRLNFTEAARRAVLVKEEEPFLCVRCGRPFGTKSSIERIVERLEGHPMYRDPAAIDRIRMCDDCRVVVQFEATDNPFAGAPRPITRTTEDYLREREEIEAARAKVKAERGDGESA